MSPAPRDPGVRIGTMSLEDGARVDFSWLRGERRLKVLSGMDTQGLDALILGGAGNVHYVSGARLLGRAGVLPFGPYAVVVRSSGRVHLLSTWDEGVPPEIDREDLYPLSWNPMNLMASLAAVPGLREARRIGTDGMTPSFALLAASLGVSEFVDAGPVLDVARRVKTAEEITCLTVAAAISESALSVMESALQPGVTERELLAVYYSTVAGLGVPVAPTESVCFATPLRGRCRFGMCLGLGLFARGSWWCWRPLLYMPDMRRGWRVRGWWGIPVGALDRAGWAVRGGDGCAGGGVPAGGFRCGSV